MPYKVIKGPVISAAGAAEYEKALEGLPYKRAVFAEGDTIEFLPKDVAAAFKKQGLIEEVKHVEIQKL